MKRTLASLLLATATLGLWAHPGHGHENPLSPEHYTGTPEHALPLALVLITGVALAAWGVFSYHRHLANARRRK